MPDFRYDSALLTQLNMHSFNVLTESEPRI